MKSKVLLVIVLIAIIVMGSCARYEPLRNYTYEPIVVATTKTSEPTATKSASIIDVAPIGVEVELDIGIDIEKLVVPAYFEFDKVKDGTLVDTWTDDGFVNVGQARVTYEAGEPVFILIFNGSDETKLFALKCVNAPRDVNHADCTGMDYVKAPATIASWVTLSQSIVSIGAGCARAVPFALSIPEGTSLPEQWEFRILITDATEDRYSTAHEIRMFITGS